MSSYKKHPASYRDPAGFVFEQAGNIYRQVNQVYAAEYEQLVKSGLYERLVLEKKLLPHQEINENLTGGADWYKTISPQQLDFISYPYEWCFSQWKEAALLTLDIAQLCMQYGMMLKDATPFNIQFVNGAPVFIDSLSFEQYDESTPWVAYRQFIECFAVPLLLAKYHSAELLKLFQLYPDGIPMALTRRLLPWKSRFNSHVFLHIQLPQYFSNSKKAAGPAKPAFSKQKLLHIINSLRSFIGGLSCATASGGWDNYYAATILSADYASAKMNIITAWLKELPAQPLLDIGTNTGVFAIAAAQSGKWTIAVDADSTCIDQLYMTGRQQKITNLIPLCIDITNPAPATGWQNQERPSFLQRLRPGITMALALLHHLVLTKNIPLPQVIDFLAACTGSCLIVEFVPLTDEKARQLLANKVVHHALYDAAAFEELCSLHFTIEEKKAVPFSERILYKMKKNVLLS